MMKDETNNNSVHPLRRAMTNLDSVFKSRDIALPTKVFVVNADSQDREAG